MIICGLTRQPPGRDQGKDRPACLVAASDSLTKPRFVVLLPITHSPPDADTVGIEIPAKVKQALGLDDAPSWVIVSEHNVDEWPNAGLSPIPGRPGSVQLWLHPTGLVRADQSPSFSNWLDRAKAAAVRR